MTTGEIPVGVVWLYLPKENSQKSGPTPKRVSLLDLLQN
jgi:hypothetical protein